MRKVRTIMVPVPPGQARFPDPKDLDEMAAICERLSKRCPSLKLISPGCAYHLANVFCRLFS